MSNSGHKARDLLASYDRSLEQQITSRGASLPCADEDLWLQVEELLRDGDAQEIHCLGLDPLKVMEESLQVAAGGGSRGRLSTRVGLQGLTKAFEVLEQAALNLYLGPWREEYKVVKMYSGMFTHCIKPVLSMQQTEKLFSLLGYQPCSVHHEQLLLQPHRLSRSSSDDLLRWSCAFFLARCECRLLLTALGKHSNNAQWELSIVRERQRGHSLQVALDNAKKAMEVRHPLMEPNDGEGEMDLYTADQVNGAHGEVGVDDDDDDDKPFHSLMWMPNSSAPHSVARTLSNGEASSLSLPPSSFPSTSREPVYISTLKASLLHSNTSSMNHGRQPCGEAAYNKVDFESHSLYMPNTSFCKSKAEADACSCLDSSHVLVNHCIECNTFHQIACALIEPCCKQGHKLVCCNKTTELMATSSPSIGGKTSPMLSSSSVALSSLALCDGDPKSIPISYHDCCDLSNPDPGVLCFSCNVFHSCSCRAVKKCINEHKIKDLGICSFVKTCRGKPHVLCRYCGNQYCKDCWFRNPIYCTCGQTFDQSSPV